MMCGNCGGHCAPVLMNVTTDFRHRVQLMECAEHKHVLRVTRCELFSNSDFYSLCKHIILFWNS